MPTQRLEEKRVEEHVGERERKRERALWLFLLYVFASTWACPMQIGLSQECCLFYLRSSLWSLDLPLTFLVFLATTILDSFSLFYLPNTWKTIGTRRTLWTYLYPSMQEINISYDVYPPCVTRLVRGVCINRERKFRAQKSVSTNFVTSPLIYSPSLSFA